MTSLMDYAFPIKFTKICVFYKDQFIYKNEKIPYTNIESYTCSITSTTINIIVNITSHNLNIYLNDGRKFKLAEQFDLAIPTLKIPIKMLFNPQKRKQHIAKLADNYYNDKKRFFSIMSYLDFIGVHKGEEIKP